MLEDSRYEATLAATTLRLVHHDLHSQLSTALKSAKRAVRPTADHCAVCGGSFLKTSAVVFPCGHPIHEPCFSTGQCPVCAVIAIDRVSYYLLSNNKIIMNFFRLFSSQRQRKIHQNHRLPNHFWNSKSRRGPCVISKVCRNTGKFF